jgi:hypothetical protein
VEHEVDDDGTTIAPDQGLLLIDAGSSVHDPWMPVAPVSPPASELAPPFSRLPVVLLIGVELDSDQADWARALANGLLRHGVDARLAVPEPADGLHLTRPCLPGPDAISSIRAHVVVPLDDATTVRLEGWLDGDRRAFVAEFSPDMTLGVQLVDWRIGLDAGRTRARIGPAAKPKELAAIVDRLCGGPQPLPPVAATDPAGAIAQAVRLRRPDRIERPATRGFVALVGSDISDDARLVGLLDHLEAAGHPVATDSSEPPHGEARETSAVVLVNTRASTTALVSLADERRREGLLTVLDVAAADWGTIGDPHFGQLPEGAAQLASACRLVTAPSAAGAAAAAAAGCSVLVLPSLVSRAREQELLALRLPLGSQPDEAIGWRIDRDAVDTDARPAVTEALTVLMRERPSLRVELTGSGASAVEIPAELETRVRRHDRPLNPRELNRCAIRIWTPDPRLLELTGQYAPFIEGCLVGVPTVLARHNPAASHACHPRSLLVVRPDDPDAWLEVIRPLVAEPARRARRSREVIQSADVLLGSEAAASSVHRFTGWLASRGSR